MRCAHCNTALPAAAKFCLECGARVTDVAPAHPPPGAPAAYTPRHLAERILAGRQTVEGERKQVTVLFADIKGSMELSERIDAEEWHLILDRFFAILTAGVHRYEGTVNQYTGDGVMALFGAPLAHEDHAQRAAHAALELQADLRRYADELRLGRGLNLSARMGLNSGEVVVGTIGDDLRMDYTAIGHTVGLAARMEQIAEPGRIYVSEQTAAQLRGFFTLRELGALLVKGVPAPVRVAELVGVGALRSRFERARSRGLSRFVGRDGELGVLEAALADAVAARGRVVGVVAEPGIGKSRLCHEFAERCRARGVRVTVAHGLAHGRAIPLLPWLEQIRNYFGVVEGEPAELSRDKIAGRALRMDAALADALPALFEFLGVGEADAPPPPLEPGARQRELFDIVDRLMRTRSRRGEVHVHVWEDLHWFDAGSEACLANLVDHCADTRTLIVTNYRPEYVPPWVAKPHATALRLAPLGAAEIAVLLDELLGPDPGLAELRGRIAERAAGNPFFVEELVRALAESGALIGVLGAFRAGDRRAEAVVPTSVQDVLAARIDRLPEPAKAALHTLAVIGKRGPAALVQEVLGGAAGAVDDLLDALSAAAFIHRPPGGEATYAFTHPLTHEIAYRTQLGATRARTHAAVARLLATRTPDAADERAALIAHHCEAAGESLAAAYWHRRAAEWAVSRDLAEAQRHWRSVLALTADSGGEAAAVLRLTALVQVLELGWRLGLAVDEAAALYREGVTLAVRAEDRRAAGDLAVAYDRLLWSMGRIPGEREADAAVDSSPSARFNDMVAALEWGRVEEALSIADACLAAAVPPGSRLASAEAASLAGYRGLILAYAGRLPEALAAAGDAAEWARVHGHDELQGLALNWVAQITVWEGNAAAALARARQAAAIGERLGSHLLAILAGWATGAALCTGGDWAAAAAACGGALARMTEQGVGRQFESIILAHLAEARAGTGDHAGGESAASASLAAGHAVGNRLFVCRAELARATVLLTADGAAASRAITAALDHAAALANATGLRNWLPLIAERRADLAAARGDTAARRARAEAADLYAAIGAVTHAARLRGRAAGDGP